MKQTLVALARWLAVIMHRMQTPSALFWRFFQYVTFLQQCALTEDTPVRPL
jgi:hypothetical protein